MSPLRDISSAVSSEISDSIRCQLPSFSRRDRLSIRIAISAMLNMAVTRKTAMTMHSTVIRLCRLRTLAEIGIKLK